MNNKLNRRDCRSVTHLDCSHVVVSPDVWLPMDSANQLPTERQFCDDERSSAHRCRRRIYLDRRMSSSVPSPTRLWRARAVLRATAGRRRAGQRETTGIAGRLNYLPRSHAHVDSQCILMLHRRTAGCWTNGHLFATGWAGKRHPHRNAVLAINHQNSFLPRRTDLMYISDSRPTRFYHGLHV